MLKTREEVQKAFGLANPPDDEFMALLEQLGEGEVVTGVAAVEGEGYTADELAEELEEAVVADSVGELLARARKETGRSLRDVVGAAGLSHARVRELEQSSNVEVATLVRVAEALGYCVKIVLEPKKSAVKGMKKFFRRGRTLSAEL
jgi:DNA-binding phage protein